jgi:hypothetical protein
MSIFWYILLSSAVVTHLIKLAAYMKRQQPGPLLEELFNYYLGGTEAAITTVGTVGIVWVLGSVYIDKLAVSYLNVVINLPLHPSLAFLLGFMGEFFGPKIIKVIYHWFVPGSD